jgi:large subunit ribosomal protein L18
MARKSKVEARKVRHRSARKRIEGTPERPRLVVFRSARHIYAQIVDDIGRKTLVAASDLGEGGKQAAEGGKTEAEGGKKKEKAKAVGAAVAKKLLEKGIKRVVFDRAGYKYHGRVSAVAEGAREAGLEF